MKKSELSEVFRELGRRGGRARKKKLTAERRSEISRKAAKARWQKKGKRNAKRT